MRKQLPCEPAKKVLLKDEGEKQMEPEEVGFF